MMFIKLAFFIQHHKLFFCSYFPKEFRLSVVPKIASCCNQSQDRISIGQEGKKRKGKIPLNPTLCRRFWASSSLGSWLPAGTAQLGRIIFLHASAIYSTALEFFLFFCIFLSIFLIGSYCRCNNPFFSHKLLWNARGALVPCVLLRLPLLRVCAYLTTWK